MLQFLSVSLSCLCLWAAIVDLSSPGMAAVLFAAVLISTSKETIVFDLLVKRVGLETFAKAQDSLLTHSAFVAGEHRAISSAKMVQAEADAGMQLFDPDSCAVVRAILGKVQSKIYSAALAAPSSPSSGSFRDGAPSSASGVNESVSAAATAAASAREAELRAELERERGVVECLRAASAAAAQELLAVREQASKDREDLKTMLANESLLSRALDEKKRECLQLCEELKRTNGTAQTTQAQGGAGSADYESVIAKLKEELAAARVAEANSVREMLAATAAAASSEEARAKASESLMSLKAEHADVRPLPPNVVPCLALICFGKCLVMQCTAASRALGANCRQRRESCSSVGRTAGHDVFVTSSVPKRDTVPRLSPSLLAPLSPRPNSRPLKLKTATRDPPTF